MRIPLVFPVTALVLVFALQPSWADDAALREKIMENVALELEPKGEELVGKSIQYKVYAAKLEAFSDHNFFAHTINIRLYQDAEGEVIPVFTPTTNEPLPYMDGLIHPDFRLTAETAEQLKTVFETVMPENFFDDVDDVDPIRQVDGKWQFITGTFFDDLKGFVVETDDEGKVTAVTYSLGIDP